MRALLRSMRPDNFEDISAVGALYRPGPMGANAHNDYADRKNHRKPVVPIHPELAEPLADILGDTYGLIVYQEQVMAIAQKVAGYSLGSADLLRRAMGKKKKEILDKEFAPFEAGMKANGYSASAIKTLWDILVPFSDYAFNKAHSAAYGLVSYWTAYLKANYPAEYMAGLLTSVSGDKDKSALYLNECRRMGITVLPPGRQRVRRPRSPRSATTSGSAWPRSATSAPTWWTRSSRRARPRTRSPASPTSCARSRSTCATSGSSSRWSRPGRSTRSGMRARAWPSSTSRPSTP